MEAKKWSKKNKSAMRVWGSRYSRDLQRYNLALRMIEHEARTQTICAWTGLPADRIVTLYECYVSEHGQRHIVRHRGPPPQRLILLLRPVRMRSEAAAMAGLCRLLEVIPAEAVSNARRELPGLARGERLCRAFEIYRSLVPDSGLTFDHVVLLITAVAEGRDLRLSQCVGCGGAIVTDMNGASRRSCVYCSNETARHAPEPLSSIGYTTPPRGADGTQQALF